MDKSSERGLDQLNTDPNVVQNKSTLPMTGTDSKKMRKIGKIKTGSQFVQLIESRYLINKETQSSDFDQQITPKEMHELIYKMDTEFYSAIAEELSYKALVFLEELGLDSNKIGTMFNLNIMKKFVTKLNETTMSDNKKRDILSMLMYFNKNNLDQCVEQDGSRETDKIYKDTILRANIKEELSGDLGKINYF